MKRLSNFRIFAAIIVGAATVLCSAEITLASVSISAPVSTGVITLSTSASGLPKKYTETVTPASGGKLTFDMVLIPGGEFTMGSSDKEAGRKDNEGPQHEVSLEPFYLCTLHRSRI